MNYRKTRKGVWRLSCDGALVDAHWNHFKYQDRALKYWKMHVKADPRERWTIELITQETRRTLQFPLKEKKRDRKLS